MRRPGMENLSAADVSCKSFWGLYRLQVRLPRGIWFGGYRGDRLPVSWRGMTRVHGGRQVAVPVSPKQRRDVCGKSLVE